jgi:hypothetical protein
VFVSYTAGRSIRCTWSSDRAEAARSVREIGMPIDPAALARNLSALAGLDAEGDLGPAMQQITTAAKALLGWMGPG